MENSAHFKQTLYTILDKENLLVYDEDKILKINIENFKIDEIYNFKKLITKTIYNDELDYVFTFSQYNKISPNELNIKYYTNDNNIVNVVNKILNDENIISFIHYIFNRNIKNIRVVLFEDKDKDVVVKINNKITLNAPHINTTFNINYSVLSSFITDVYIRSLYINTDFNKMYNELEKISEKIMIKISNLNIHIPIEINFDYVVFEDRIFFVLYDYIREIKDDSDIQEITMIYMKRLFNLKIIDEEEFENLLKILLLV
jgi:hypothetical protein